MTTVHISLGRDDGTDQTAAKGVVEWEPTTRREDGTMVILERGFVAPLVDGEATVVVDPSGLTWCWRVTERTDSGGTVRYVSAPDSATTVEYVDLPDVDPTTLVAWTPADPEAAYLASLGTAVDDYLLANPVSAPVDSVNGQTGAVILDATDVGADPAGTAAWLVGALVIPDSPDDIGAASAAHTHAPEDVTGTAVITTDTRLSDARTPLAHSHTLADVTDAGDAAGLDVGTTAGTVAAGDHTHAELHTHANTVALAAVSGTNTGDEPAASTTVAGIVELATTTEVTTGTDTTRAVTPAGVKAALDAKTVSDSSTYAPIPTGVPDGTKYLRDDNTWQPVTGGIGTDVVALVLWDETTASYPARSAAPMALWRGPVDPATITGSGFLTDVDLWAVNSMSETPVAPDDTTAPTWTATFTMGTPTENSVVATASAMAADDTAVTAYEVSYNDGSTYAAITPSGSNFTLAGTAGTTYATTKLRAKDAAGNTSTALSVPSYTMAASTDTTPPTAGTLTASSITDTTFTLTVTGASDETALAAEPYSFDDGSGVFGAYQASASMAVTGKIAETGYTCQHRVKDAAGNISTGTAITVTTEAAGAVTSLFTDFSEYTTGAAPTGWTQRWSTDNTITIAADAGATGGKVLQVSRPTNGRAALSWDQAPTDQSIVDVAVKWRGPSVSPSDTVGYVPIRLHGSGAAGSENAYSVQFTKKFTVIRYIAGALTTGPGNSSPTTVNVWRWTRLRVEAGVIYARYWNDGDTEPTAWESIMDNNVLTSGWIGVGLYSASVLMEIDAFGVAWGGPSAPTGV